MTTTDIAYILLGSNINPQKHIPIAISHLKKEFGDLEVSKIYESKPVKYEKNDNFLNAVVAVRTNLEPLKIKYNVLRMIEEDMGRKRSDDKYAPRRIDLDLIALEEMIFSSPDDSLELPDPEILEYKHVAVPLADVAPKWTHPANGKSIHDIIAELEGHITEFNETMNI